MLNSDKAGWFLLDEYWFLWVEDKTINLFFSDTESHFTFYKYLFIKISLITFLVFMIGYFSCTSKFSSFLARVTLIKSFLRMFLTIKKILVGKYIFVYIFLSKLPLSKNGGKLFSCILQIIFLQELSWFMNEVPDSKNDINNWFWPKQ